jgi:hypothetical protein
VNNITGSATNDGLSWATAMSEPSYAITASETYRELGGVESGAAVTTNDYVMNTIVVQGTATGYLAISTLPSYCNVIGLGGNPRGNGYGIASFTQASGTDTATGSTRGSNWYNLQFTGSGTGWAMDFDVIFRSTIETCTFYNKSTGAMRIVTGGGVTIRDCDFGGDSVATAYGLYTGTNDNSGNFNSCLVVDSSFTATTAAIYQSAYWANATRFTNNLAMGGTYGIQDNSHNQGGIRYLAFYDKNFCYGSNSGDVNDAGMKVGILPEDRCIGNWCNDHGIGHWYVATS